MLGSILCVTSTITDLDKSIAAYSGALGYQIIKIGRIEPDQAANWNASAAAGRRYVILAPGDGEIVFLRLIENPESIHVPAHATFGWNVTEFNVGGVEALNKQLAGGPFQHVAGPAPLSMNTDITAMQALGPDGELVYFTQINPGPRTGHLPQREMGVGRVFIMVLGVNDLDSAAIEFKEHFGCEMTSPIRFSSTLMSSPLGLPETHEFRMGLVRLPGKFSLEIDELGSHAHARPVFKNDLPSGLSIVSFATNDLDRFGATHGVPIYKANTPFGDARAAIVQGPGSSLFEVIST